MKFAEMKDRVVDQVKAVTGPDDDDYLEELRQTANLEELTGAVCEMGLKWEEALQFVLDAVLDDFPEQQINLEIESLGQHYFGMEG